MAIESQNIYKNARKSAGFTQEKASQLLNVSVDSLRDYEQSQRPVPSDVASAMCDVYQAPYLAVQHLRLTSDLGKRVVPEIQLKDLPEAVLGVLAAVQRFCAKREAMVEIAADGQIAESEQAEWDEIMRLANDLNVAIVNNRLDVLVTIFDSLLGGRAKDNHNFCGGTGSMLSFAPDGSAYPCIRYAPISIGEEKSKKVRFGSVYDGLYVSNT